MPTIEGKELLSPFLWEGKRGRTIQAHGTEQYGLVQSHLLFLVLALH